MRELETLSKFEKNPATLSENVGFGLVYWGLTPQQQPGSYQGGGMMMKSVFWWRKPEYPEETADLRQVMLGVAQNVFLVYDFSVQDMHIMMRRR